MGYRLVELFARCHQLLIQGAGVKATQQQARPARSTGTAGIEVARDVHQHAGQQTRLLEDRILAMEHLSYLRMIRNIIDALWLVNT
ncbi:hypothetical protein [Thauera humireducens]|uniref:hypothetical protein n=1 Tax=Thauera humireducens TaxID=1134435 RepID=UPI00311E5007